MSIQAIHKLPSNYTKMIRTKCNKERKYSTSVRKVHEQSTNIVTRNLWKKFLTVYFILFYFLLPKVQCSKYFVGKFRVDYENATLLCDLCNATLATIGHDEEITYLKML